VSTLVEVLRTELPHRLTTHPEIRVRIPRGEPLASRSTGELPAERVTAIDGPAPALLSAAAPSSEEGSHSLVIAPASYLLPDGYPTLRSPISRDRLPITILALESGLFEPLPPSGPASLEDLGALRAFPHLALVVPPDPGSLKAVLDEASSWDGPVYLRLNGGDLPELSERPFAIGRARELHPGSDLTIASAGPLIGMALEAARELARVGIEARVLDLSSVKPFDEKAVLRAARDTGAVLTVEDHSSLTGLGALVAATTSENYPVPVRRIGVPDLFLRPEPSGTVLARYGLGPSSILDEAWELLRQRGKVD
jgi:transketolase